MRLSPIRTTGYMVVDAPGMALVFEDFNTWYRWAPDLVKPLRLDVGREIKGRVLTKAGDPVANAEILLTAFNTQWFNWRINYPSANITTPEASTHSAADGTFTLRAVLVVGRSGESSGGTPILLARATQGGVTLSGTAQYYANGDVQFALRVEPTSAVRGRITNALDGKPLGGARVSLVAYPGDDIEATIRPVQTQADGSFVFNDVAPQRLLFATVTHPDFGNGWTSVEGERATNNDGAMDKNGVMNFAPVEIKMRPLANVQGRVLDVQTKAPPLTPMSLSAIYSEGFNDGNIAVGSYSLSSRVNPDGTFTMKMPVGHNHIRVRGAGYWEGGYDHPIDLDIQPGDNKNLVLEVRREKGFLTHFSTSAAKGKPDYNYDREYDLMMRGKDGKESSTNWGEWWQWPLYKPDDTLDIRVTRFVDGFPQEVVPWTTLTPNRTDASADAKNWPREIRLPLRQTLTVKGRVLDAATGKALAGASVSLMSRPAIAVKTLPPVISGANGEFVFESVPLPTELLVTAIPLKDGKPEPEYSAGWTRVGKGELTAIATDTDQGHQEFNNIMVRPSPLVTISGKVIDSATNAPPVSFPSPNSITAVPITDFIALPTPEDVADYNKPLQPTWKVPPTSFVAPDGSFFLQVPAGVQSLGMGNYYEPDTEKLEVPAAGLTGLIIKAHHLPFVMLRFTREDGTQMRRMKLEIKAPGLGYNDYFGFNQGKTENTWYSTVKSWGEKVQVRLVEDPSGVEVFSGEVVSDPKNWPVEIRVPAPK